MQLSVAMCKKATPNIFKPDQQRINMHVFLRDKSG